MSASAVANKRLRKELAALQVDPPPGVIAEPDEANILLWYYVIRGPTGTPYEGGEYVGKLKFPPTYPMAPPSVMMLTPSGRFQTNTRLCMSMSDFHPESWNPMWSVSTLLQGVVSFMTSEEVTTGGLKASDVDRKRLATVSQAYNRKHFAHLFDGDMTAAFARAEQARGKAEAKRVADAAKAMINLEITPTTQSTKATAIRTAQERESREETTSESTAELTEEQKEKRRLRNAKKRAKQKAKKSIAASADMDEMEGERASLES